MKKFFTRDLWQWPEFMFNKHLRMLAILMFILTGVCVFLAFKVALFLGYLVLFGAVLALSGAYFSLRRVTEDTSEYISDLSYRIKRGEQDALIKMPIGILFYDKEYFIEWINPYMQRYFDKQDVLGKPLKEVDPELFESLQNEQGQGKATEIKLHGRSYNLMIQKDIHALYLTDVTKYVEIRKRYEDSRLVIGQIFLDNYDEVTSSMNDKDISNLGNFVTNALSDWAKEFGIYLKRVDEDHFFILTYAKTLSVLEKEKFKILDEVREWTSKQNSPITLSIGIAYGAEDLTKLAKISQNNLDLALGRGGDQVVVKADDDQARFYGGKTNPMEKRTRVRARMISQALTELMNQADQIFVMGHDNPDMDSLGACLGVRRIAAMNGKQCWIVLDQEKLHSDIQKLLEELEQYPNIKGSIITPEDALEKATKNSLLIMVDHSKPSISIAPKLYERLANRVMVIDHHRRGEEFPDNPILVYIEPYASSTCELITELFEYQSKDSEPINKLEATAMLTGIIIDTQSFAIRTGTRTFDAASYLRSVGADLAMARHFMKESVTSYMERNHLVELTDFDGQGHAICCGEENHQYDPVIAAQVADSLLNVSGVEASFVITRRSSELIGVSARSNGRENVQVIMEEMGGGGHLSNAATQIKDKTVAQVKEQLLAILKEQSENN